MDRRDFLKATAALTASSAAASTGLACGGLGQQATGATAPGPSADPSITAQICELDANLSSVASALQHPENPGEPQHHVEQCVRSLLVAGLYSELSEADRQHPDVQARMRAAMPEITDSVENTLEYIESLTSTQLSELQSQLHEDPELPDRVLADLAARADSIKVPKRRVRQLQKLAKQFTWRMAQQHPGLVLQEYADKTRKSQQQALESSAIQQRVALALGQHALWVEHGDDEQALAEPNRVPEPPTLPSTPVYGGSAPASSDPAVQATPTQPSTQAPAVIQESAAQQATENGENCTEISYQAQEAREELRRIKRYREKYRQGNERYRRRYIASGAWLVGIGAVAGGFAPLTLGISATIGGILLIIGVVLLGMAGGRKRLKS